jgi:hypothetical protein
LVDERVGLRDKGLTEARSIQSAHRLAVYVPRNNGEIDQHDNLCVR